MANLNKFDELQLLEDAKLEFQENVSALLEIEGELNRKTIQARANKKPVFVDVEESEIISKHLRNILTGLLRSYEIMNHSGKHLVFQKHILDHHPGQFVTEVKRLIAQADQAA